MWSSCLFAGFAFCGLLVAGVALTALPPQPCQYVPAGDIFRLWRRCQSPGISAPLLKNICSDACLVRISLPSVWRLCVASRHLGFHLFVHAWWNEKCGVSPFFPSCPWRPRRGKKNCFHLLSRSTRH
uniref:Putative secreted protein n=1 Tax=Rhipicephalus microplus TaxID=6941 RepID=A0A6G5A3Y4_RHIMP